MLTASRRIDKCPTPGQWFSDKFPTVGTDKMTEGDGHIWNWLSHKDNKRNAFIILEEPQPNSYFEKQDHGLNKVKLASSNFSPYTGTILQAVTTGFGGKHHTRTTEKIVWNNLKKPI